MIQLELDFVHPWRFSSTEHAHIQIYMHIYICIWYTLLSCHDMHMVMNGHWSMWLWLRSHSFFKQMLTKLLKEASEVRANSWDLSLQWLWVGNAELFMYAGQETTQGIPTAGNQMRRSCMLQSDHRLGTGKKAMQTRRTNQSYVSGKGLKPVTKRSSL